MVPFLAILVAPTCSHLHLVVNITHWISRVIQDVGLGKLVGAAYGMFPEIYYKVIVKLLVCGQCAAGSPTEGNEAIEKRTEARDNPTCRNQDLSLE